MKELKEGLLGLRRRYIAEGLGVSEDYVANYTNYSIAFKDGIYVMIDDDRILYVFKPIYESPHKPRLLEKVTNAFRLPIRKFKPFMIMSGGVEFPALVGGEEVKDLVVNGWLLKLFRGSFIVRNHKREWIEGQCVGIAAKPKLWNAEPVPVAIRKIFNYVKRF